MSKTPSDNRSKVIVFSFAVILILLLLWGWNKGPRNTIINKGGDVVVDTPRFPDYDPPALVLPAFGGNRWDWMQTTDCACDCGPHENYAPVNISGPSIYIYRAAPAVYNLPSIAAMPPAPTFNFPALPAPEKGVYYRDVWSNRDMTWAQTDEQRTYGYAAWDAQAKEVFRATDGTVFLIGSKTKVKGVSEADYYFGANDDLHYKGKVYSHDVSRDKYRKETVNTFSTAGGR